MKKFIISCYSPEKGYFTEEVDGYSLVIAGFEKYKFFVHNGMKNWTVSETTTGSAIIDYCQTKKQAIETASKRLNSYGLQKVDEVIERSKKL